MTSKHKVGDGFLLSTRSFAYLIMITNIKEKDIYSFVVLFTNNTNSVYIKDVYRKITSDRLKSCIYIENFKEDFPEYFI